MKKILFFFILFTMNTLCVHCEHTSAKTIEVKQGQEILVSIDQSYSSKKLKAGEQIKASVEDNVYVNGTLIFKQNDPVYLYVTEVVKAKRFGSGGTITLEDGIIYDAKGNKRRISYGQIIEGENKDWVVVAGIFLFPFWFMKGENAIITPKIPITVKTNTTFNF